MNSKNFASQLGAIKKKYDQGENIIQMLKALSGAEKNDSEIVQISYDLQAGSYIQYAKANQGYLQTYTDAIKKVIGGLGEFSSILEAGVGEATTLCTLMSKMDHQRLNIYGFDISWSRLKYAQSFQSELKIGGATLFLGDLFNIPFQDNAIDIVYTSHSIEPNGGREEEALKELYRVCGRYLVLLEPSWEFGNEDARTRMEKNGYVKNLYETALSLGFEVVEHRLFEVTANPLNPTGLIIIKKDSGKKPESPFACPRTREPMLLQKNCYFSEQSLLAYPIIDGVPCLHERYSTVATHFADF